jgi:imidazolonepropionase-like amidohydrolase
MATRLLHLIGAILLSGTILLSGCAMRSRTASAPPLAITNVTLIDVRAATPEQARLAGRTVLLEDGAITAVGASGSMKLPRGAKVVDGRGKFLAPGLWDAHVHLGTFGESALPLLVAEGVTSVRDMGGDPALLKAWRDSIERREVAGPQIFMTGRIVEGAWWLDRIAKAAQTDPVLSAFPFLEIAPRERLSSASDAARAVSEVRSEGIDLIKFRNLRTDEFNAVAAEARKAGLPLTGHSPRSTPPGHAAEAGMTSIEHMETVTLALGDRPEGERLKEFARMAAAGTGITATLITDVAYRQTPDAKAYAIIDDTANRLDPRRRFLSGRALAAWRFGLDVKKLESGSTTDYAQLHRRQLSDLRLARAAGVPILIGTDLTVSLIYPGSSVYEEMRYLVANGGLSPFEALKGATFYPARAMRLTNQGYVAAGARADLVLLERDPVLAVPEAASIDAVVLNGRLLRKRDLDRLREESARLALRDRVYRPPVRPVSSGGPTR